MPPARTPTATPLAAVAAHAPTARLRSAGAALENRTPDRRPLAGRSYSAQRTAICARRDHLRPGDIVRITPEAPASRLLRTIQRRNLTVGSLENYL